MQFWRKSDDIRDARFDVEELQNSERSRRQFLTRSAAGVIGVAGGAAVLNAVMAAPAGAAVGDTTLISPVRVFDSRPGKTFAGSGTDPGTIFTYDGAPDAR